MTVMRKSMIVEGTWDAVAKILGWSFNVLLTGLDPAVDEHGNAMPGSQRHLADGWKGVLTLIRGDWEFYHGVFNVPHWTSVGTMCWLCGAVGADGHALRYSLTGPDAGWRFTRTTMATYLAALAAFGIPIPPWFRYVRGLDIRCLMIDVLHALDLGVCAHVIGNVFWEVIGLQLWGTNVTANLAGLEKAIKDFQKAHRTKNCLRGKLSQERIRSDGWPKFLGKAAERRGLVDFAVEIAQAHLSRHIVLLCQMLQRLYTMLNDEPRFLSDVAKDEVAELGDNFCQLYSHLAGESHVAGLRMWKATPKLHMFCHLCQWTCQEWGNPTFWWAYADEDMVEHMISVAQSCHPRTMATTALWKYLVCVFEHASPP